VDGLARRRIDRVAGKQGHSPLTGRTAASSFVEKLEDTVDRIAAHPEAGSPRYAHDLSLPGLRFSPITGFPHLVFYVVREEVIDVWRVLHGERDIPAWMRE